MCKRLAQAHVLALFGQGAIVAVTSLCNLFSRDVDAKFSFVLLLCPRLLFGQGLSPWQLLHKQERVCLSYRPLLPCSRMWCW